MTGSIVTFKPGNKVVVGASAVLAGLQWLSKSSLVDFLKGLNAKKEQKETRLCVEL